MRSIAKERFNKYEYDLHSGLGDYTAFEEKVFLGQFSWTTTKSRKRILSASVAKSYLCEVPQTPTEIARDYLDIVHPSPLRCTAAQREAYTHHKSAPLYYQPTHIQGGVYLDVVSAYLTILDVIGWNVDYHPGKFLSPGRPPQDFPLRYESVSRNSLVTCGLHNTVPVWTGWKLTETSPRNIHINYGLWTAVQDILHLIARRAIAFGAFYCNTDGYILPDEQAESFQDYAAKVLKVPLRVKGYGECRVTGVGSYMVGDTVTKHFHWEYDKPYSNIYPENDEMLQKTYAAIAVSRIDRPYLTVL